MREDINLNVINDFDGKHIKCTSYLTSVRQAPDNRYFNVLKNQAEHGIKPKLREIYNAGPNHPMAPSYSDSKTPNPISPQNVIRICLEADKNVPENVCF